MRRRQLLVMGALPMGLTARAVTLDVPEGPVVLTISGRVGHANRGNAATFDMAMLARLPQSSITTRTPWFSQARKFTGPLLRDVLASVGVQGEHLRAVALNDYRVDIPVEDTQKFDVVLATQIDDKPMSVRDKGPLFIIYPFDSHAALRNALYFSRCAWQLKAIEVL